MKRNKKEIIVRDEQQIEEKSAMAENCHAPFSRDEQIEISETTNNQEPISKIQTDLSEGVQINIEEAMSEAEEQRKDAPPVKNEDEQINEAEEAVAGRKSKKKRWTSLILMLINIAIVAVIIITQVKGNNMVPLTEILESGINWWFLLACVASFAVMTILEGIRIEIFVHDSTKKHQFPLSFKTAQIGRYYDCVTPLSTGGQPFQIYYLKNMVLVLLNLLQSQWEDMFSLKSRRLFFHSGAVFNLLGEPWWRRCNNCCFCGELGWICAEL